MRHRHPSCAAQGWRNRHPSLATLSGDNSARPERVFVKGMPSASSPTASSLGNSLTSAKITPLQHNPHDRQISSGREPFSALESLTRTYTSDVIQPRQSIRGLSDLAPLPSFRLLISLCAFCASYHRDFLVPSSDFGFRVSDFVRLPTFLLPDPAPWR